MHRALGASLATMVANLSSHKPGWDDRWEEFSDYAERGIAIQNELLNLVEEDTLTFNRVMSAFGMPRILLKTRLCGKALFRMPPGMRPKCP
jgi:glutamate formiminotransferase/formiminotetrahydrofolate cyclodeaminase